jgi:peptidylprolyl isomerase
MAETARLHIPASEAYGDKGFAAWQIPPGADLIFEIEVLQIAASG